MFHFSQKVSYMKLDLEGYLIFLTTVSSFEVIRVSKIKQNNSYKSLYRHYNFTTK